MYCISVRLAQKMDNFDEIEKNISRFKKKLFKISCFLLFPDKSSKKGSKWKMNTTFTNKKTAATPTFCKQNLRPTIHIKVMNFLSEGDTKQIKVPVSSSSAGECYSKQKHLKCAFFQKSNDRFLIYCFHGLNLSNWA